jgi:hypothetical protein
MKTNEKQGAGAERAEPQGVAVQNHVALVGYLGDKPEQRSRHAVLSLATKTSWKPKNSRRMERAHRMASDRCLKCLSSASKDTTALVSRRTWEIRARHVRKLVHKQQAKSKAA